MSRWGALLLLSALLSPLPLPAGLVTDEAFPEQDEIDRISRQERPEGIVFLVMEQDEEALKWVLPRVAHYTRQLRNKWRGLPVVVLSHGDEMFALTGEYQALYPELHRDLRRLVEEHDVLFQVCGSYAAMSDVTASAFPSYVDVVPFAPTEIENYRALGFKMLNLELTW